jgi:CRISPR/Cas system-associated exonuclease Cas4 (RecB family)
MSEALVISGDFSPSSDLEAAYRKSMEVLVHPNGPAANTRASGIGNECDRAIVYDRTVLAEQRAKHTPELQAIFELGKDFEKIAVRRLEDMGAEIVQRGRDYMDPRYQLSGHTDLKLRMPHWKRAVTCEVKGLNPYTGEGIQSLHDIRESRQAWVRKYYAQLQTYLFLAGEDLGVFVLFNKSTGWPTFIDCPLDYEYAESLLKKAERVKLHVANNTLPERHLSADCRRCAFLAVCAPDVDYGDGVLIISDPELEQMIARRGELAAAAKEYEALDKSLKDALPQREGEILIGDFVLVRTFQSRRAYAVKETHFYRTNIRRIGELKK